MKRPIAAALLLIGCGGETETTESTLPPDAAPGSDAAPSSDAHPEPPPECELEIAPNSTVQGTTPRGPFIARYARLSKAEGECGSSIFVVLSEVPAPALTGSRGTATPPLLIASRRAPRTGITLGPAENTFTFQDYDVPELRPTGVLDLTYAEYPSRELTGVARVEGSLTVTSDGFALSGSFAARHCALLDLYCPRSASSASRSLRSSAESSPCSLFVSAESSAASFAT